MSNIEDIKKLREKTLCGFKDCKEALDEAGGNLDEAIQILKKKGLKVADKRSTNETNEGIVLAGVSPDRKYSTVVSLLCETDFVAKNSDFKECIEKILKLAIENKIDSLDKLNNINYCQNTTVNARITELIGQYGENIRLNFRYFVGRNIYCYNHHNLRISSLVDLDTDSDISRFGHDVAMQIVAYNPIAIDRESVDKDIIDRERNIATELSAYETNENIRVKKIEGKLNKFFKENVLIEQEWMYDSKKNVGQMLKENNVQKVNFFEIVRL